MNLYDSLATALILDRCPHTGDDCELAIVAMQVEEFPISRVVRRDLILTLRKHVRLFSRIQVGVDLQY